MSANDWQEAQAKLIAKCDQLREDYKQSQYHLSQAKLRLQEARSLTVSLQADLIERNDQLIEAQEKLLHPVVPIPNVFDWSE